MSNTNTAPTRRNQLLINQAIAQNQEFKVGVVSPTTDESLKSVILAATEKLIDPILFGPKKDILNLAKAINIDINGLAIIDTPNRVSAAKQAVKMAAEGNLHALMKGDIHTDDLMREVVARESGLRTKRRISHCEVMDVPSYDKLLIFSDAAINVTPDLEAKIDIVQNAIFFAHALGIKKPNVALLASVETVLEYMPANMDAAILCKMAERGQITGGILDGPLSVDLAISKEAMRLKHFTPILPGLPDIFIAPDLNVANIATKLVSYLAHSQSGGIVVGATVPVVLMRRSSPVPELLLSCALAKIYSNYLSTNEQKESS